MRWFHRDREDQHGGPHGKTEVLVHQLVQYFSMEALLELRRRGWHAATPEEQMAILVASGAYTELVHFGDRAVALLQRSATRHRWCGEVIRTLMAIGTPAALDCLTEAVLERWRRGQWDNTCSEALSEAYVLGAMIQELYNTLDYNLARILLSAGWQPASVNEYVAVAIAFQEPQRAVEYGEAAVPMLKHALSIVSDRQAVLEALADTQTPAGAAAVLEALREQWARGVSRWTDSELVARCGGAVVGPLLDLLPEDPTHAVLLAEMLGAVLGAPQTISDDDLRRIAAMPDPVHLYQLPDDARTYQGMVDCSALRQAAVDELHRRGLPV